jgi:cellulose synthase/poly-beta-1,6-N-acetylglucosamine synthase-like glycosyltransferase
MIIVVVSFMVSMAIILALAFYPVIAWMRSVLFRNDPRRSASFLQPVSIIIAAHNEEKYISQKLNSFLDPGEWIEGSELIVVSNGSTDATNQILSRYSQLPQVKIIIEPEKASKILSVNRGVKEAKHDLLVFSDCRQVMKNGSVKNLVHYFSDPEIGTVSSTLMDSDANRSKSMRSFLNYIADCESISGSSLNVFGALYAQRKPVFREFPEDILFDDLYVVVSTLLQKKRLIAAKDAIIYDVPFTDYYLDDRIERLARGLLLFLFSHFNMIRRLPTGYFTRFIVFKYFKLVLPFVLIIMAFDMAYLSVEYIPPEYMLQGLIVLLLMLVIKPVRKMLILFLRINLHFLIAVMQFIFFKKRSNTWGKLDENQSS